MKLNQEPSDADFLDALALITTLLEPLEAWVSEHGWQGYFRLMKAILGLPNKLTIESLAQLYYREQDRIQKDMRSRNRHDNGRIFITKVPHDARSVLVKCFIPLVQLQSPRLIVIYLHQLIQQFNPSTQNIIKQVFGAESEERKKHAAIAREFGISAHTLRKKVRWVLKVLRSPRNLGLLEIAATSKEFRKTWLRDRDVSIEQPWRKNALIETLGLNPELTSHLSELGLVFLEDLTMWTKAEILQVFGIGPKVLHLLVEKLAENGLSLRD